VLRTENIWFQSILLASIASIINLDGVLVQGVSGTRRTREREFA
jgi:hypothetical protein